jgi:hypothetical protein
VKIRHCRSKSIRITNEEGTRKNIRHSGYI